MNLLSGLRGVKFLLDSKDGGSLSKIQLVVEKMKYKKTYYHDSVIILLLMQYNILPVHKVNSLFLFLFFKSLLEFCWVSSPST